MELVVDSLDLLIGKTGKSDLVFDVLEQLVHN